MKTVPEKFKVYGNVFDNFTERLLFELSSSGLFDELKSSISVGKEANVFSAVRDDGSLLGVKIYRLQNCNFNKMWSYLQTDPRYINTKPRRRQIIFAWVQREFRNLKKAAEAGIRVPKVYKFASNTIVMEFIGSGHHAAPQLKDTPLDDPKATFETIIEMITKLYRAGLVHGDLSSFNILMHEGEPIFIDMSQSTDIKDPNAREYLERDVKNICTFFGIDEYEQYLSTILE